MSRRKSIGGGQSGIHNFLCGTSAKIANLRYLETIGKHHIFQSRLGGWKISFTDWEKQHDRENLKKKWGEIEWN